MRQPKTARNGFTLIELLTVIAIIAVLAAILFPVFGRVREQARQTQTMSQMHDLYIALKLYREDNNRYPATLLGYAQDSSGNFLTVPGGQVSIDQLTYRPLTIGQKYLKDKQIFASPEKPSDPPKDVTYASYPVSLGPGNLSGRVQYTDFIRANCCKPVPVGQPVLFYLYDNMTIGPAIDGRGNPVGGDPELHYSLDWTGKFGPDDAQNQMKYPDPPQDKTVVMWNTHHAAIANAEKVMVLLLTGSVKAADVSTWTGPLKYAAK